MAELEPGKNLRVYTTPNVDVCLGFMTELEPGDFEYVNNTAVHFRVVGFVVRMLVLAAAKSLGRTAACGKCVDMAELEPGEYLIDLSKY